MDGAWLLRLHASSVQQLCPSCLKTCARSGSTFIVAGHYGGPDMTQDPIGARAYLHRYLLFVFTLICAIMTPRAALAACSGIQPPQSSCGDPGCARVICIDADNSWIVPTPKQAQPAEAARRGAAMERGLALHFRPGLRYRKSFVAIAPCITRTELRTTPTHASSRPLRGRFATRAPMSCLPSMSSPCKMSRFAGSSLGGQIRYQHRRVITMTNTIWTFSWTSVGLPRQARFR